MSSIVWLWHVPMFLAGTCEFLIDTRCGDVTDHKMVRWKNNCCLMIFETPLLKIQSHCWMKNDEECIYNIIQSYIISMCDVYINAKSVVSSICDWTWKKSASASQLCDLLCEAGDLKRLLGQVGRVRLQNHALQGAMDGRGPEFAGWGLGCWQIRRFPTIGVPVIIYF